MKTLKELKRNLKQDTTALPVLRIALVGDTATQLLCTAIKGTLIDRGYRTELFEGEYNQVERLLLAPDSELFEFAPDYLVIFQSTHKLLQKHAAMQPDQQVGLADERLDFLTSVCQNPKLAACKIIVLNYPEIDDAVFGSYTNKVEASFTWQTRKLNCKLMELAQAHPNLFVCDLAALQNKKGRDWLFASNVYTSTEMVLSVESLPWVASRVADIVCAAKGHFKKCLIIDLDNTLWGGVIGDDGLEGIQLGHGLGIGKAFTEFQLWVKKLQQRGIILCVVSKNEEATAKEPFLHHPDMVLRLDDIAVFVANWNTKVDNIRYVQSVLNIAFDSMVFLDDNPFERDIVRQHIPGITVPELPEDPADYLEFLYGENLFETASHSGADKDRTRQYQVEAQRMSIKNSFDNEDDFLSSLAMESAVQPFTSFNIPRVAQLTQRSNQFNLRTVRYTEADCEAMHNDNDTIDLCFTLKDRFGDNGLIAIVIMKRMDGDTLFIDSWIMSCRVLKRGMEHFTLNTLVKVAREKGYKQIVGEYLPTAKNKMVEAHYPQLGFTPLEEADGKRFVLSLEDYQDKPCHITETTNE